MVSARIFPAPGLAPAARVHLRLDDDRPAEPAGDRLDLGRRFRHVPVRHRDARLPEQRPRLVLV
jgi:hypothetical protein